MVTNVGVWKTTRSQAELVGKNWHAKLIFIYFYQITDIITSNLYWTRDNYFWMIFLLCTRQRLVNRFDQDLEKHLLTVANQDWGGRGRRGRSPLHPSQTRKKTFFIKHHKNTPKSPTMKPIFMIKYLLSTEYTQKNISEMLDVACKSIILLWLYYAYTKLRGG